MKKTGTTHNKDGINYLVVDNHLIRKFKFKDNDAYFEHKGVYHSLGMSKNTVDVSNVTDMNRVFYKAYKFNADISGWNVSNVTDMSGMFYEAKKFNADISKWNVSSVTNMSFMFYNAKKFNADISKWDVSSAKYMSHMFSYARKFNADIRNWDVSSAKYMSYMFSYAKKFNADISKWDVSSVTNMSHMFSYAKKINADISKWDVSSGTEVWNMFKGKTINDINKHNIPKWYTDRHQIKLTKDKQKQILEKYKYLPDEDKKAILKIIGLGLKEFNYKSVNVSI